MSNIIKYADQSPNYSTQTTNIPSKLQGISSLSFTSNGKKILLGTGAGSIHIWNSDLSKLQDCDKSDNRSPISVLRPHPRSAHVHYMASCSGQVHTCDITTGACQEVVCEDNEINAMDLHTQGSCFITAGKDQCIRVYDTHTHVLKLRYRGMEPGNRHSASTDSNYQGHLARIYSLKFSQSNQDVFLSGGWDNNLKVWDLRTNFGPVLNIYGPHLCGNALDLRDHLVLTGSWVMNNALQMWDMRMAKLLKSLVFKTTGGNGQFLYCAKFCSKDLVLSGGSGTDSAQLLDWKQDIMLTEICMSQPVHAVDCHDMTIAVGGNDSYFKISSVVNNSMDNII